MQHRVETEDRQHQKGKVIVCRNDHALTWRTGVFIRGSGQGTARIYGLTHFRRSKEAIIFCRADSNM